MPKVKLKANVSTLIIWKCGERPEHARAIDHSIMHKPGTVFCDCGDPLLPWKELAPARAS